MLPNADKNKLGRLPKHAEPKKTFYHYNEKDQDLRDKKTQGNKISEKPLQTTYKTIKHLHHATIVPLTDHINTVFFFTQKSNPNHVFSRVQLILRKFSSRQIVWTGGKNLALPDTLRKYTARITNTKNLKLLKVKILPCSWWNITTIRMQNCRNNWYRWQTNK